MSPELIGGLIGIGFLVGILSAVFGVGGGLIIVTFMVLALDETQQLAEGTSLLVVTFTAAAGVTALRNSGHLEWRLAALLALGGLAGSVGGARLALITPGEVLQRGFGTFIVLVGIRFVWQSITWKETQSGSSPGTPTS